MEEFKNKLIEFIFSDEKLTKEGWIFLLTLGIQLLKFIICFPLYLVKSYLIKKLKLSKVDQ